MKAQPWVAKTLLATITLLAFANAYSQKQQLRPLESLRAEDVNNRKKTLLERAYLDAYGMLTPDTQCGRFFGLISRTVLDEFVIKLRDRMLNDSGIAIRLSGPFIRYIDSKGTEYRLFERAEINTDGAFYRSSTVFTGNLVPNVGSFHSNTRQARVLMLLHELGHLIRGSNGVWLLPDDGNDFPLSRSNNATIEYKCGEQIRAL